MLQKRFISVQVNIKAELQTAFLQPTASCHMKGMFEVNEIKRLFLMEWKTQQDGDAGDSGLGSVSVAFKTDGL